MGLYTGFYGISNRTKVLKNPNDSNTNPVLTGWEVITSHTPLAVMIRGYINQGVKGEGGGDGQPFLIF